MRLENQNGSDVVRSKAASKKHNLNFCSNTTSSTTAENENNTLLSKRCQLYVTSRVKEQSEDAGTSAH